MKTGWHEILICLSNQATVSPITLTSQPDSTPVETRPQTSATDVGKLNTQMDYNVLKGLCTEKTKFEF